MAIIMMNLLVGLAVDDIQEVQRNAELKKLSSQVKIIKIFCIYTVKKLRDFIKINAAVAFPLEWN